MTGQNEEYDVTVHYHGSVCIVVPETDEATEWIDEFVYEPMWYCGGIVVEPRYLENLVAGMEEYGLEVSW